MMKTMYACYLTSLAPLEQVLILMQDKAGETPENGKNDQNQSTLKKLANPPHFKVPEFQPSYHAAGIFTFALRPKKRKQEIVVLMLLESRNRNKENVLNFPGGKQNFRLDLGDPVLTAVREFTEETAHIYEFDSSKLDLRLRSDSNKLGLTRCLLQQGSYFLLFGQIPYLSDANERFLKSKDKFQGEDSATQQILWVPLKQLMKSVKSKKIQVEAGTDIVECAVHTLVEQLFAVDKISEKLKLLKGLCSDGHLRPLAETTSEPQKDMINKKRKRDDSNASDDEKPADEPRRFGDNEDDFGDKTMRLINFEHADWDGLLAKSVQELSQQQGEATVSKKLVRKAVVSHLVEELRGRLHSICEAKIQALGRFDVQNGYVKFNSNKRRKLM
jgi:hypothetical protein